MTLKRLEFGGQYYQSIILPKVVEFARNYFECDTLEGVPLEDGGGSGSAGSHWEKTYLSNSYIQSVTEFPGYISNFTLSLLNNTGWYFVIIFPKFLLIKKRLIPKLLRNWNGGEEKAVIFSKRNAQRLKSSALLKMLDTRHVVILSLIE